MTSHNKVVSLTTTIAMTISALAILIGSGIGWGILQTKVLSLEARADSFKHDIIECSIKKVEKDVYYKDQERFHSDLKEIKEDIKTLLHLSGKTNRK